MRLQIDQDRSSRRMMNRDYEMTLDEVAAELGVTREYVGQVERKALSKIEQILDRSGRSHAFRALLREL